MEQIQLYNWTLNIDKDATEKVFNKPFGQECSCTYCRNFTVAVRTLPSAFLTLLQQLGIDARLPTEVAQVSENPDGSHLYLGWYHFVGTMLLRPTAPLPPRRSFFWQRGHPQATSAEPGWVAITDTIQIRIVETLDLLPAEFPTPALQLEFWAKLAWTLEEPPEQAGDPMNGRRGPDYTE